MWILALAVLVLAFVPGAHARERAPGAPGDATRWAKTDKQGFGTSATRSSRVWFTLRNADVTEVYYPDLAHPSARGLTFMVDGRPVAAGTVSNDSLTYTQRTETEAWRLTRAYVTDPERATLLIKVRLEARDGEAHDLEVEFDPALYGNGDDDVGWSRGTALLAHDRHIASALVASPSLTRTSSGYKGRGESTLLEHTYDALRPGNVVQQAHTRLTGRGDGRDLTLALGFGPVASQALKAARDTLEQGWDATAAGYRQGWADYRNTLLPIPAAALPVATAYETSLLVLKAHEDKDERGAFIAGPSAGNNVVRAQELYHAATALLAAGDRAAANRALTHLFARRVVANGLPILLAHQLAGDRWTRVRAIADKLVAARPKDELARAQAIAGLICAADIARKRGADSRAARYERTADAWQRNARATRASALELVRLGVKRAADPAIVRALPDDDRRRPLRAGARGEYELAAGRPANGHLEAMASAAGPGMMLGEEPRGAAPLAWPHAQLIRLAWSIESRGPVETPKLVADRYD